MNITSWNAFLGLVLIIGSCIFFSEDRKSIRRPIILWGLLLQIVLAVLIFGIPALKIPGVLSGFFMVLNDAVVSFLNYSDAGAKFLFGSLATDQYGFIFAVRVLPTIIFVSALFAWSYHIGLMPRIVEFLAHGMRKLMPVGGAESLSTAANIFVGQTEAPLMIKPYLSQLTRSELFCIMVGGMSNTAGGVLAAFVMMLQNKVPNIAGHLIAVSVMSGPATFLIAKILIPETSRTASDKSILRIEKIDANSFEALARGASEGMSLALNVAAMIAAFTAIVALVNGGFTAFSAAIGHPTTLQEILGFCFSPLAWLLGVDKADLVTVGRLLGEKIVLNEFVAFSSLASISSQLSPKSALIAAYALSGFANFSSIGIQVGGIGAMVPEKRGEIAKLGFKALIAGNLATFSSACIVALLTP